MSRELNRADKFSLRMPLEAVIQTIVHTNRIGKSIFLKKLMDSTILQQQADVFSASSDTESEKVIVAGEKMFCGPLQWQKQRLFEQSLVHQIHANSLYLHILFSALQTFTYISSIQVQFIENLLPSA